KAGLDVCVVEKQDKVGGGVITREVTLPGFKHDLGSTIHAHMMANPLISNDELGLKSKYGLSYIKTQGPQMAMLFPDGEAIILYPNIDKTCECIEKFSKRDAEAYPKFCQATASILEAVNIAAYSPPPSLGTLISFLEASEEGREYLRVILSSPLDIAEEWFESEQMKMLICGMAGTMIVWPWEKGTGVYVCGLSHIHKVGASIPQGGAGALSEALEECIKDNGGTIMTLNQVNKVKVDEGKAKGVILNNGDEIKAKNAVVSCVNVKQLFLDMLSSEELPPSFQEKVGRIKHSAFAGMRMHIAVKESAKYIIGGDLNETLFVNIYPSSLEKFLRIFEGYAHGIPSSRMPSLSSLTLADPTRAPKGKHTFGIHHHEPYSLRNSGSGNWDEMKQNITNDFLKTVRMHTINMGDDNILDKWISSPLDYERENPAMICGDTHHIGSSLSQSFGNRPIPGWHHYKTPIKKLYMCGASTYPTGGVSGSGRIAVQIIMEDLGLDFRKVVAK
ncbi:phytoene desaturase family protein, partial [Chloroflexota bacterium]